MHELLPVPMLDYARRKLEDLDHQIVGGETRESGVCGEVVVAMQGS